MFNKLVDDCETASPNQRIDQLRMHYKNHPKKSS